MFEDAQAGIDAVKAAKMACVGIGPENALTGADLVIPGVKGFTVNDIMQKLYKK